MCGRDGFPLAVYAELLEDVTHVRADRLAADRERLCDQLLRQPLSHEPQDLCLARAQRMLRLFARCTPGAGRLQAGDERTDAGDELAWIERLAHIIVAAKVEAGDLVVALGAGAGNEDDANAAPIALEQAAANVITRHPRQLHIEQDNPRLLTPRCCERRLAACHRPASVTRLREHRLHERSKRRIVLDDQNAAVASQARLRSVIPADTAALAFGSALHHSRGLSPHWTPNVAVSSLV